MKIDMHVLVNGIDCEFGNSLAGGALNPVEMISALAVDYAPSGPTADYAYTPTLIGGKRLQYKYCRPRLNHWHVWQEGFKLPEGLSTICIVNSICQQVVINHQLDTNELSIKEINNVKNRKWEIIAIKIVGLKEGYELDGMEGFPH